MTKERENSKTVTIKPANMQTGVIWIKGSAPLVVHKFSNKARAQIMEKQAAGSTAKKNTKKDAKDFDEVFNGARHISTEGWDGIHAAAFRNACVSACRLVGYKMSIAKLSIMILADGTDCDEGTPLVRIIGGAPRRLESLVRVGGVSKTIDISVRPQWIEWGARLRIRYDADQFTAQDVVNLVARAGMQVGVGEGRPDSTSSCGMGWGTFDVSSEEEVMALEARGVSK